MFLVKWYISDAVLQISTKQLFDTLFQKDLFLLDFSLHSTFDSISSKEQ